VGLKLSEEIRDRIIELLTKNVDLFAWTLVDMPRVDPDFCCHKLSLFSRYKAIAQKNRNMGRDRYEAIED